MIVLARNDHAYIKRRDALKARAFKNNEPCALCGDPIDFQAPYTHSKAFTADHIDPINAGGNMLGPLQPAHRGCNSRKGDGSRQVTHKKPMPEIRPTTTW